MPMGFDDDDDVDYIMGIPVPKRPKPGPPPSSPSGPPPKPEHDLRTSHGRFWHRLNQFKTKGGRFPRLRHLGWWWLHNLGSHIMIGLLPIKSFFRFHDWTSDRLNLKPSAPPKPASKPTVPSMCKDHVWVIEGRDARGWLMVKCAMEGCPAREIRQPGVANPPRGVA